MSDNWDNNRTDNDDEFMGSSGSNYPSLDFPEVGTTHEGVVRNIIKRQDTDYDDGTPLTWPNGDPKWVWLFEIEQPNGEIGIAWIRGNAVKVIREAVTAAGAVSPRGWHLKLQHHALGEATTGKNGKPRKPPKLFRAKITPAAARQTVPDVEPDF